MRRPGDDRALASALIGFITIIVISALIFIMLQDPMNGVFASGSSQATSQQAQDAISLREQIWDGILWYVLLLAGVFLLARSVVESRRGA